MESAVPQGTPNELVLSLAIIIVGAIIRYFERRALKKEQKRELEESKKK